MGMAALLKGLPKVASTGRAMAAKVAIRAKVLAEIGAANARVFDAFAGEGHMHKAVWSQAYDYVGCDKLFIRDDRPAFVADNRRVLRAIDLSRYNLFDLDAYGSPWEQVCIIANRRKLKPGERLGLVITEGEGMKMKMGGMSVALAQLAGVHHFMAGAGTMTAQGEIITRATNRAAKMMGGAVTRRWEASIKTGSSMHYVGFIIEAAAVQ